ncbi:MAG TPA: NADH-quinone oxidoreductase subunit N [Sphingobacteriaceae bacterium]|nr:NADH-quinone oxidoreductase subunit N [Sphingobacteriaceae bacterium]
MPVDGSLRLILPEIILAVAGVVVLAAGLTVRSARVPGILALLGIGAAAAALNSHVLGTTAEIWSGTVVVDGFGSVFKVIFLVVGALTVLVSLDYVHRHQLPAGEFYILILLATVGMMFMASSLNLLTIYLGLECLSLASYSLAGMLRKSAKSTEAALKYILVGAISSGIVLFGMSLLFGVAGSLHLQDIAAALSASDAMAPVVVAGMMFLIAGLGVKMAAVPFHMWAPDVYQGSPAPVAAFLITASEAAAFAAALRIFMVGLPALRAEWTTVFILLAVVSMTVGNITAILQTNMRRMLAYSAVAQAGYIMVGLAVASPAAVSAMIYYLIAYAFMTVGAFAVVILVGRHHPSEEIRDFQGLSQRSPLAALALTIFLLSLIGIPPTAGFFGKFYLIRAAVGANLTWLAVVMMINSIISIPYYWGVVRTMYLIEAEDKAPLAVPAGLRWAAVIGLAGTLILGLFPDTVVQIVSAVQVAPAWLLTAF